MRNYEVLFSHNTDDWRTPSILFNRFIECGYIDLCPYKYDGDNFHNIYYDKKIYINPPFSKLRMLVEFIRNNYERNDIYLLMPSRTDTEYFYEFMKYANTVYFIKGRLHFNDLKSVAPFPTLLIHFEGKTTTCKCSCLTLDELIKLVN